MRVAVLSDTHLPGRGRGLPQRVLEECAAADAILHGGDVVSQEVLLELGAYAPLYGVLGNCDPSELASDLPERRVVELAGVRIGMIHDAGPRVGRRGRLRRLFPDCRIVVFGHSHQPVIDDAEGLLLLNPGSAVDRRREPVCTMARLELDGGRIAAELIDVER